MGWRVRADEEGEIEVREGGVGRGSDERSRSADWEGPGERGPLPGGHGGGQRRFCGTWGAGRGLWSCRSLWRQLAAAGPSGGEFWPLQVSLAAIVCCRAVVRLLHSPLF